MEKTTKTTFFSSKASIVGLFSTLTFMLTIPLIVLLAEQPQDIRQRASEPIAPISVTLPVQTQGVGSIAGYVYYDTNKNGERDNNEKPFPGVTVIVTHIQRDKTTSTVTRYTTDSNGYFAAHFTNLFPQIGSYVIKLSLPDGFKTINTNPVILPNQQKDIKEVVTFGLFPLNKIQVIPTTQIKQLLPTRTVPPPTSLPTL